MTDLANTLSNIDRVRLIAHGSLGIDEPDEGNVVSFSKARRERAAERKHQQQLIRNYRGTQ